MHPPELDDNPYYASRVDIIIRQLIKGCKVSPNDWFIIDPYSIGDAYYTLAYLKAFRERWVAPGQKIIFVCSYPSVPLVKLFPVVEMTYGVDMVHILPQVEAIAEQRDYFMPGQPLVLAPHMLSKGRFYRLAQAGKIPFPDLKKLMLNIPLDTPASLPTLSAEARSAAQRSANEQGVEKGRSVVIFNHASSYKPVPDAFWQAVVASATKKGLKVFTDVFKNATPVPGTHPLSLKLEDVIALCEYAGACVVLRSGLVDLLSTANCRLVTIYPGRKYALSPSLSVLPDSVLTLKGFGQRDASEECEKEKPVFLETYPDLLAAAAACVSYID